MWTFGYSRRLGVALLVLSLSAVICGLPARALSAWMLTGSMLTVRVMHTATLLRNGQVLVTGGASCGSCGAYASAELYDPSMGTWTATGRTHRAREYHTATLLPNGQVLIAGGCGGVACASAELYDPRTGAFTPTGNMTAARYSHTATLFTNGPLSGTVLLAGGFDRAGSPLASAELYDPRTGTFTSTGAMTSARAQHTATLLGNGRVLIAGGCGGTACASAELYDPRTGTFTSTGSMTTARVLHTATLLGNGRVLVAGGVDNSYNALASAELYDPGTGTFIPTGAMTAGRVWHTTTRLRNGQILVAGGCSVVGYGCDSTLASAELYDPGSGTFTSAGSMIAARVWHTATLLGDGQVLVAGGATDGLDGVASAELYTAVVRPTVP